MKYLWFLPAALFIGWLLVDIIVHAIKGDITARLLLLTFAVIGSTMAGLACL